MIFLIYPFFGGSFLGYLENLQGIFPKGLGNNQGLSCVFPVEPQRPHGKNINLHKKWGFRRFQKECRKVRRNRTFCAKSAVKICAKSAVLRTFRHFSALFLESAETPLFVQINVFAVWPLRLDRRNNQGLSREKKGKPPI